MIPHMNPLRALVPLLAAATLAACSSAPAPTPDATYITDLGMTHSTAGEQALISTGHTSVCDGLAHGQSKPDLLSAVAADYPQMSASQVSLVIDTAVTDLCPAQAAHL